jgi:hypothetical protein
MRSRYWTSDPDLGEPGAGTRPSCVYYNGAVLFDAYDLPGSHEGRWIAGACLRGNSVLVMLMESWSGGTGYRYRVVRAGMRPNSRIGLPAAARPPRMEKCVAADMSVLLNFDYGISVETTFFPLFNFNQSGTEARAISVAYDDDFTEINVSEWIVDTADLSAVSRTITDRVTGIQMTTTTTITYPELRWNAMYREQALLDFDPAAPSGPAPGTPTWGDGLPHTWTGTEHLQRQLTSLGEYPFADYDWGAAPRDFIPVSGEYTVATTCTETEYPCAVDYINDVPVYAHYRIGVARSWSGTRDSTLDNTEEAHRSGERSQECFGDPDFPGAYILTTGYENDSSQRNATATRSTTGATDDVLPGLYCPNPDLSSNWLDVECARTDAVTVDASTALQTKVENTFEWDDSVPSSSSTQDYDWSYSHSYALTYEKAQSTLQVLFLDLRFRAAAVQITTETTAKTFTSSCTGSFNTDPVNPTMDINETTDGSRSVDVAYDTTIYFYGEPIATWSGYEPTDTDTATYISGPSVFFTFGTSYDLDMFETGWRALAIHSATLTPEDPLWPGYTDSTDYDSRAALFLDGGGFAVWIDNASFDTTQFTDLMAGTDYEPDPIDAAAVSFPQPETVSVDVEIDYVDGKAYCGTWIAYRQGWMYSMPNIEGDRSTAATWRSAINDATHTLNFLAGDFAGIELYSAAWPLSAFTFNTDTLPGALA